MRLLFDEQLSARLCSLLADSYPGALHIGQLGMAGVSDENVWRAAASVTVFSSRKTRTLTVSAFFVELRPR